jgi:tetratricopeptide (TPR) repeat protein
MMTLAVVLLASQAPAVAGRSAADAVNRGEAYYQFSHGLQSRFSGDGEAALEAYRRAQKLDPRAAEIRVETARLLRDMSRFDEALVDATEATKLDPEDAQAFLTLGQIHQLKAEGQEAATEWKAAAEAY